MHHCQVITHSLKNILTKDQKVDYLEPSSQVVRLLSTRASLSLAKVSENLISSGKTAHKHDLRAQTETNIKKMMPVDNDISNTVTGKAFIEGGLRRGEGEG
jgi:hypothetical protein